jgi:hypothetical protein
VGLLPGTPATLGAESSAALKAEILGSEGSVFSDLLI